MTRPTPTLPGTYIPSEADSHEAEESCRRLATLVSQPHLSLTLKVAANGHEEVVTLPSSMARLISDILTNTAQGSAIQLHPIHAELSTHQAAELLHVSNTYFVQLLDDNKLPYHSAGTQRLVNFQELLEYKRKSDIERRAAMDELAQLGQEMNMWY